MTDEANTSEMMGAPESGVRVRMYRQHGLGDCFLLAFRGQGGQPFYMLIDCGVFLGTKGGAARMREIAADIGRATGRHLNVLVATHEHYDHLSGFDSAHAEFDEFQIDDVWMAWTEDPSNEQANRLRQKHAITLRALTEAVKQLEANVGEGAESLKQLVSFSRNFDTGLSISSTASLMTYVRNLTENPRYWHPGESLEQMGGVEGVRVYVLGPPEDEELLSQSDPSSRNSEVYEEGHAMSETTAFVQALISADEINRSLGIEVDRRDQGYPFDESWCIRMKEASKDETYGEFFRSHYGFQDEDKQGPAWRRINEDWLRAAGSIALKLDEDTNNTSLALAFELVNSGKVLLFPADAQVGNWLSWHKHSWKVKGAGSESTVSAKNLLERTVLYKVGHHGSHNATLREKGLEMMTSPDLVAMIPVDKVAAEKKKWAMPFSPLFDRLAENTRGRILQADTGLPEKPNTIPQSEWEGFLEHVVENELWIEYTILDEKGSDQGEIIMAPDQQLKICVDRILDPESLVEASERAITENPTNRPAINFTPGLGTAPLSPFELAALTAKKWDNGRMLRVHFMDGDPEIQERLKPFAHEWSDFANIQFNFVNDPNAEIRISFQQAGSWSYIGTDALSIPKHRPTMNYGWLTRNTADDEYSRVVIHEFGHALGCFHEHQHPTAQIPWNKEAVYAYYAGPPNNWSKADVDRNLFQRYASTISQFSEFDQNSIMLYAIPKDMLTDPSAAVGWNRVLSDVDKSFIGVMYPKVAKAAIELSVNARSTVEKIGEHGEVDLFRFRASEAGRYRIITGGWTNVVMSLYGPNNDMDMIAMDDDSGFLWNARIVADLSPGDYYVRVRHFRPQGIGSYRIRVAREA